MMTNLDTSTSTYLSPYAFQQTLERIESAIAAAGLTIFARIDHAAAADDVGMTMPQAIVLLYGNPRGGTPVMIATPNAALDLPLRVLIREEDGGQVIMAFHPIARLLRDAGVSEDLAARLQPAQALLLKALQQ
jgi:uncharacterized protein (DUF302 family)